MAGREEEEGCGGCAMAGGGGEPGCGHELTLLAARRQVSPFVMRVCVALNLKGLRYNYVLEDLAAKSDLLLASNPVHKQVPVLLHAGRPVCESAVILHYLDDAFPGAAAPLLPADDPYARATHRLWAARVDAVLHPAWMWVVRAATAGESAAAAEPAADLLDQLERVLGEAGEERRRFFGGDAIGYLDVVLGSFLSWLEALRAITGVALLDAARTPRLVAWAERFGGSEAVRPVTPEVEWVVAYAEMLRARWDAEISDTK